MDKDRKGYLDERELIVAFMDREALPGTTLLCYRPIDCTDS